MNSFRIISVWLDSWKQYLDEIESTFDIRYLIEIWEILLDTKIDLFWENREVLSINYIEST